MLRRIRGLDNDRAATHQQLIRATKIRAIKVNGTKISGHRRWLGSTRPLSRILPVERKETPMSNHLPVSLYKRELVKRELVKRKWAPGEL